MNYLIGYNTNGFQNHRLLDALLVLEKIGYNCIALTLDHPHLNPFLTSKKELLEIKNAIEEKGMKCVIETGARYLLDPFRKHYPTFLSKKYQKRIDYLKRSIEIAKQLNALCVSFFSGKNDSSLKPLDAIRLFTERLRELIEFAQDHNVPLALEPEPGMLVEKLQDYDKIKQELNNLPLHLTLDIGHVICVENFSIPTAIEKYNSEILNIHLEDIAGKKHIHLPFGEGNIHFPPIFQSIQNLQKPTPLNVELSRSSHQAPEAAKASYEFIRNYLQT
ncbi:MAG: sugar phosphate isomerase/epimerase [Planctomycetota bacterium]|nr:MAG: sugar phosphate isomerase/epimerase [Planctomycetota bacterium]